MNLRGMNTFASHLQVNMENLMLAFLMINEKIQRSKWLALQNWEILHTNYKSLNISNR